MICFHGGQTSPLDLSESTNENKSGLATEASRSKNGAVPSLGKASNGTSSHRAPASFVRPTSGTQFDLRFEHEDDGKAGVVEEDDGKKVKLTGASLTATFPDGFALATKNVEEKRGD